MPCEEQVTAEVAALTAGRSNQLVKSPPGRSNHRAGQQFVRPTLMLLVLAYGPA